MAGYKLFGGGSGGDSVGGGDSDIILDNHGNIAIDDNETLIWDNFRLDPFGSINVQGDDTLRWHNFIQNQGSVNASDEIAEISGTVQTPSTININAGDLKWQNFDLGSLGDVAIANPLRLFQLFQWGEQVAFNNTYNNPNNALGRPNNVFADSTTDASDDRLDIRCGPITSLTGLTWMPELTQVVWSYQTNQGGLLALLGEEYWGEFRAYDALGPGLRQIFRDGDGVSVVPSGEEYGQTAYGGQRMITANSNVRSDIDAMTNPLLLINEGTTRFLHIKGVAAPQGDLSVDAVTYSMWFRDSNASAPTVTRELCDSLASWNTVAGTPLAAGGIFSNNDLTIPARIVRTSPTNTADFVWIVRTDGQRDAVFNRNHTFRFLCPANNDDNPCFAVEVRVGISAANDRLRVIRIDGAEAQTELSTATPSGGWVITGAGRPPKVGVWLRIEVYNSNNANINPTVRVWWYSSPGVTTLLTNVLADRSGVVTTTTGYFGLTIPVGNATFDDLFWLT